MSADAKQLEEAIRILRGWWMHGSSATFDETDRRLIQTVCAAAEAHLATLPKTRMVEVWHVQWVERVHDADFWHPRLVGPFTDHAMAQGCADDLRDSKVRRCIRVTGPHQQEVPA